MCSISYNIYYFFSDDKKWERIKRFDQNSVQSVLTYIIISNLITIIILNIILKSPSDYILSIGLVYVLMSVFYIFYIVIYSYYHQIKKKKS